MILGSPELTFPKSARGSFTETGKFTLAEATEEGLDTSQPLLDVSGLSIEKAESLTPSRPALTHRAWPPEKFCLVLLWPLA